MSSCEAEGVKGMIAFPREYNELIDGLAAG
jgi:hypothetical protein